ncbi:MAG TPA: 3-isopropylmalate dehydratase small subunit [Candidatus Polarisedimenticolia bacterium]|nr:3-isopropylmalate dehydratase small subunit [Candidatus Polarisedimenticolia bacterium]
MDPIRTLTARCVVVNIDNIDTDVIIPARFLKTTDKRGLGRWLFANWRYAPDGSPRPDFVLNQPAAQGAQVLVAGDNFGCGSSREHAPWALLDHGFRAVVSTSIASIFRTNALKNGLLPVAVPPEFHLRLVSEPGAVVRLDLEACSITLPDGRSARFPIDPFARYCLLNGLDELDFLLHQDEVISAFESR